MTEEGAVLSLETEAVIKDNELAEAYKEAVRDIRDWAANTLIECVEPIYGEEAARERLALTIDAIERRARDVLQKTIPPDRPL